MFPVFQIESSFAFPFAFRIFGIWMHIIRCWPDPAFPRRAIWFPITFQDGCSILIMPDNHTRLSFGIHEARRVLQGIPINTRPIDQPQRVCLNIPPQCGIVIAHPVLMQAIFRRKPLPRKPRVAANPRNHPPEGSCLEGLRHSHDDVYKQPLSFMNATRAKHILCFTYRRWIVRPIFVY